MFLEVITTVTHFKLYESQITLIHSLMVTSVSSSSPHHQCPSCYLDPIVSSLASFPAFFVVDRQNGQCPFWRTCSSKSSTWKTYEKHILVLMGWNLICRATSSGKLPSTSVSTRHNYQLHFNKIWLNPSIQIHKINI